MILQPKSRWAKYIEPFKRIVALALVFVLGSLCTILLLQREVNGILTDTLSAQQEHISCEYALSRQGIHLGECTRVVKELLEMN